MHKDDLKKTIVKMLGTAEIHGYEVQKQLASRGFRPNISYLYRVLGEIETEGYLEGTRMKSASNFHPRLFGYIPLCGRARAVSFRSYVNTRALHDVEASKRNPLIC